jgi:hypothetical protein
MRVGLVFQKYPFPGLSNLVGSRLLHKRQRAAHLPFQKFELMEHPTQSNVDRSEPTERNPKTQFGTFRPVFMRCVRTVIAQ